MQYLKGATRKLERIILQGHVAKGQWDNGFKLKEAQAAQSSCGCPIPGSAQGQAGWGWEQPGLGGGVPARGRGWELGGL